MFSGRQILKNTLLLTAAALLLRFASMLFQAHLAGRIGAEGLGAVQLLLSVFAFATTLGLAGMRVAASCLCAQAHGKREPEQVQLAISNSLSQVRQYSEMPLKIWKAEQLVGGEEAMDQILHDLFNRELDPMYPYLTYQEFLDACGLTEEDLNLE